ncbi:MAG: hypothetical protein AB8B78_09110 [Polaribacter sp.]
MHGAWGALTSLIKRQEAAKNRKAALKYELQKRRESFLSEKTDQNLEFPEISDTEMKVLKEKIRKKYRVQKIRNGIINLTILALVFFLFYYIFINVK